MFQVCKTYTGLKMILLTISFLSSMSDSGQFQSLFSKFQSSVALFLLIWYHSAQLMHSNKRGYLPDAFRLNGDTFVFFESDFTSIHTEVHTPTFYRNLAACQHNYSLLVFFLWKNNRICCFAAGLNGHIVWFLLRLLWNTTEAAVRAVLRVSLHTTKACGPELW